MISDKNKPNKENGKIRFLPPRSRFAGLRGGLTPPPAAPEPPQEGAIWRAAFPWGSIGAGPPPKKAEKKALPSHRMRAILIYYTE
jgi:hypothetical protein